MKTLVLIACCGKKAAGACAAKDMYLSPLFLKARAWAEGAGLDWAILSAKHGVLWPDQGLEPYDVTLPSGRVDRIGWDHLVARQLVPYQDRRLIVLAGERYCGWTRRFNVTRPMLGMGIGRQLQFLGAAAAQWKGDAA